MRTSRASINASGHREQWRGPYSENACESVGERAHGGSLTIVIEPPCVGERGECRGRDPPGTLKWQNMKYSNFR